MYNWRSMTKEAPRYFRINSENHTGKRLYKLIGPDNELLVTNCCKELGTSANSHGKPDVEWLSTNLWLLSDWFDLLLICGNVASKTYEQTGLKHERVITMLHPAARTWTKELIERMSIEIQHASEAR